jgi:hypothetical protein
VSGKTFRINEARTQITITAGGEPILWRLIRSIQSNDPATTATNLADPSQGIITNSQAVTKFSYWYTASDIYQNEPLQDGVLFRLIETSSGAITWKKFTAAGDSGNFEDVLAIPAATICSSELPDADCYAIQHGLPNSTGSALDTDFLRPTF